MLSIISRTFSVNWFTAPIMTVATLSASAADQSIDTGTYTEPLSATNGDTLTLTGNIIIDAKWESHSSAISMDDARLIGSLDTLLINLGGASKYGIELNNKSSAEFSGSVTVSSHEGLSDTMESLLIADSRAAFQGPVSINTIGEYNIPVEVLAGEVTFNNKLDIVTGGQRSYGILTMSIGGISNTYLNGPNNNHNE
ncbi:hypothetical protein [Endozoicomonas sp.]|uniref:hypothetical protein n=1 Tax=Endozoicomonas sp. TaxID=1892382 RepID=UPI003AF6A337